VGMLPKGTLCCPTVSTLPVVGKYQLIRKLATGGMAEVYLAKTAGAHGFEKTVVLKRILPHLAEDENFVNMFLGEAKLAAQLNHPNVVTVFDFGEDQGSYYLVMEYIDGPNLRALFKRANELKQPIAFGAVAKIISFACEGLAFAHDFTEPDTGEPMNLVHRDISPDNILLARNGGVKVVDFGIAKASNQTHHTRTGTIKGKFAYMPPEQLRGANLDRRADIFALGIVLHELVAGVKPFDVASDATIMQAILYEKMRPASEVRPDTPPALQAIIDRSLEKDRDARYADCRAMQQDLEKYILSTGEPVGQFQLSTLVKSLATPSQSNLPPVAPKTPSHPSLAVNMATPMPSKVSIVVDPTDVRIELSKNQPAPPTPSAPPPPPVQPPPPPEPTGFGAIKPQLEIVDSGHLPFKVNEMGPVMATATPTAPPKRGAWVVVLAIGLLFLGAGGALVGVKVFGQQPQPQPEARTEPVQPVPVAVAQPAPPPAPKPAAEPPHTPEPAPAAVAAKEEPEPPALTPPAGGHRVPQKVARNKGPPKKLAPEPARPAVVAEAPKPAEPAPAPAPQPKVEITRAPETGTIAFRIRPYATVLVDGKYLGDTPVAPITVPVGMVNVTLINKDLGKELKVPFEVKAGQNTFKYNLEE
jgi:eukaryotic-like serine/threonine-protein kinase